MILQLYLLISLTVLLLALGPFLSDPSQPKTLVSSWAFLALAVLLSPITLPNMIRVWMHRQRPGSSGWLLTSKY